MNIAVCEDNEAHRERLKNMIAEWAGRTGRRTQTACFASAEAFEMAEIPAGGYDLIFLDIQMKQMDGMKLAEKIREQDDRVLLVFTTSYEDYAIAGYDVGAFAYLLKPLAPDKVFQTLSKAAGTMKRNVFIRRKSDISRCRATPFPFTCGRKSSTAEPDWRISRGICQGRRSPAVIVRIWSIWHTLIKSAKRACVSAGISFRSAETAGKH